ncbi:MAG: VWA domain-containing protein, partial [Alphaproteobacteria bacterium]|nr:VWA domain-containing protein [Alphaproteobacteria bacterium]
WFATRTSDIAINMSSVWSSMFQTPMVASLVKSLYRTSEYTISSDPEARFKAVCVSAMVGKLPSKYDLRHFTAKDAVSDGVVSTSVLAKKSHKYGETLVTATTTHEYYMSVVVEAANRGRVLAGEVAYVENHLVNIFSRLVLGALVHECGHSVFSRYLGTEWHKGLDGYRRSVLTMFEEIRSEASQTVRLGLGPTVIRGAADIVVDPRKTAESFLSSDPTTGAANVALNSTLILGRGLYGVYTPAELTDLNTIVETFVGGDRFEEMHNIWRDTIDIYQLETDRLDNVLDRWVELFPSPKDGSGVSSHIISSAAADPEAGDTGESSESDESGSGDNSDLPTEAGDVDEGSTAGDTETGDGKTGDGNISSDIINSAFKDFTDEGDKVTVAADIEDTLEKEEKTPRQAFIEAMESTARGDEIVSKKPTAAEFAASRQLANALRQINVTDRGKVVTSTHVPPGKLHTRAAMARSIEKRQKAQPSARPWKRTTHTTTHTPPLTVGVMTDVSGSQSWATQTSATLSWVLPRAVSEINGAVSAVTFGSNVQVMCAPGDRPTTKKVRHAVDGTEKFCDALLATEHMLQLSTREGVRILIVFTDGVFVAEGELERATEEVEKLTDAGVFVLWVTPSSKTQKYGDCNTTPPSAHYMHVNSYDYSGDDAKNNTMKLFNDIAKEITRGLAKQRRV